jgi:ABC-type antimicrobial peptide transport system permease subunit
LGFGLMIASAAIQAIARNKLRSLLTMLGVFIGVAALIAMVAVGQGANEAVEKQIASLGSNLLVVLPGATTANGVRGGFGSASTLTVSDAEAVRREDLAVGQVSYLVRQTAQVEYGDQNWTTVVQGVSVNYPPITNWEIAAGRALSDDDESQAALVALLGQTVYHQLFAASESPIGATVLVKGVPVRVIGVLAGKGQSSFGQDQDDLVMLPVTTAQTKVLGVAAPTQAESTALSTNYPPAPNPFGMPARLTGYVNSIYVQAVTPTSVQPAIDEVTATLDRRHSIRPGEVPDFAVRNLSQIANAAEGSSHVMSLLLAVVASISLLVGGIGIMNILLVSVTERTREIGLRMAIGARRVQVLLQFLAEAVFLSVTGGAAGIIAGIVTSELISVIAGWPTVVLPMSIVGGFFFSVAVGVFFGYYPARKASHLDPIEALHFE